MKALGLLPALGCAVVFVLCNLGTKFSLNAGKAWLMHGVYGGAILAYWMFRKVCSHHGLAVSSSVVDSLVTVATVMIGILVLHEQLNVKQYVGLLMILIGLQLVR
jgi:multidrug transporter EmrE-like cation transporter